MNSEVEDLFEAARRLKTPPQRPAFLDAACCENPKIRRELEELLALESDAKSLLDGGAASLHPNASELRQFPSALLASAPVREQVGEWVGRYKLLQAREAVALFTWPSRRRPCEGKSRSK